jgi:hypothetical protein
MLDIIHNNRRLGNGKDVPHITPQSGGLSNTNPIDTRGLTFGSSAPMVEYSEARASHLLPELRVHTTQVDLLVWSGQGGMIAEAKVFPRAEVLKPPGQVVLFQKIMEDWGFSDQEAAMLLGFEAESDIAEIYLGTKSVEHRDGNDRLRAVLRIATDLDALYQQVAAIRDWLSEPQRDLDGATPRSLLTEGSMENLLRVKYYVAYLSGR